MDLLFHPGTRDENGKLLPVPLQLRKFISPWAKASYYEYPFGRSLIQLFSARKFSIHIWRIEINNPGKLYPSSDCPTIALQFMLEGSIPCMLVGYGPKLLQKSTYELFYVPVSVNEALFAPGSYESFHIELEPGFLEDIAEAYPGTKELLTRFNKSCEKGIPMVPVNINYVARAIIKNIKECKKTGVDLVIDLHRYTVDLLSEYLTAIREQEREEKIPNIAHKEIMIGIKQEITAAPHIHKQKLSRLSTQFGINSTELKKNFHLLFGMSPGAFIRYHALAKAHYLITSTTIPIDDIAEEVGYPYRINFDKAFKIQFGYLPTSLRENDANSV